jgi:hypothetical protein
MAGSRKSSKIPGKYKGVKSTSFAVPASKSSTGKAAYPINTRKRAVSALARVKANGTPTQKKLVQAKVAAKYPSLPSSKARRKKK